MEEFPNFRFVFFLLLLEFDFVAVVKIFLNRVCSFLLSLLTFNYEFVL